MTMRWKLSIEYDGTPYSGWQRQEAGIPSVQEEIEKAIFAFSGQKAVIHVAGRTDAGVHARGQVAHVDLLPFAKPMEPFEVAKAINAHLKNQPISVFEAQPVPDDFHARFSAVNKLYEYRIINRGPKLALDETRAWNVKRPLHVEAMRVGASYLLGQHDFTTFRDSECQAKSPIKTLDRLDILETPYDTSGGVDIRFLVEGRSFLHHQVRNMVGTLVMVGEGKWKPEEMKRVLEAKDRTKGGMTAPAQGLYLVKVDYSL